ncbi:MAG: BPL-N domain-containing protein [Syntrophales bacterium]
MAERTTTTQLRKKRVSKKACALLWDESFAWGLMARQALMEAGLPFDLLRSEEIRGGALTHYRMLYVPGGWASQKQTALGDRGQEEIKLFVEEGGSYVGICGGAGMATVDGIGLVPIRRKPTTERVPSISGPVRLSLAGHMIWHGIDAPIFFTWWPSQFRVTDQDARVLASYEEVLPDTFSADICVTDGRVIGWPALEARYGILLEPARLHSEPALLEGHFGRGKVLLSLIHFDTPGDRNGSVVLRNLWDYLASGWSSESPARKARSQRQPLPDSAKFRDVIDDIKSAVSDMISTGSRNFLWYWRNPLLLQWRRGVRGLEYGTLAVMTEEIGKRLCGIGGGQAHASSMDLSRLREDLSEICDQLIPFIEKAKRLLIRERFYMNTAPLSPLECSDPKINRLRLELFGSAMSHGGDFKRLIDPIDRLLFNLIRDA